MAFFDTIQDWSKKIKGGASATQSGDPASAFDFKPSAAGPVPGVAQVGQTYLAAKDAYSRALAGFNKNRLDLAQQQGFSGDIDPETGTFSNIRVDQTNPYGAYQQNRRSHAQQFDALRENAQARGIGGKGLGAQAIGQARFDWGNEDARGAQGFLNSLDAIDRGQQDAYQGFQNTYWQALLDATRAAQADGQYDIPTEYFIDNNGDGKPDSGSLVSAQKKVAAKVAKKGTPKVVGAGFIGGPVRPAAAKKIVPVANFASAAHARPKPAPKKKGGK